MLTLLLAGLAGAVELETVRVFVGEGHARVLLIADGPLPEVLSAGPRAEHLAALPGVGLDPTLQESYRRQGASTVIAVRRGGVDSVRLEPQDRGLSVWVSLDEPRALTVQALGTHALLLDLQRDGLPADPTLPDPQALLAWLEDAAVGEGALAAPGRERLLIVVDPGHGGAEPGAIGLSGTREADVALAIALRLARELEQELGAEVVLTRTDDSTVPLQERAALANRLQADLFISVHANAAPGPTAWGIETYYMDEASDAGASELALRENAAGLSEPAQRLFRQLVVAGGNQVSKDLAEEVHQAIVSEVQERYGPEQTHDLGVKTAMFHVLVATRMPAILVETGFLTQPADELRLRHPPYQQAIAESIAQAVGRWAAARELP